MNKQEIPVIKVSAVAYGYEVKHKPIKLDDATILDNGFGYTVNLSEFGINAIVQIKVYNNAWEKKKKPIINPN